MKKTTIIIEGKPFTFDDEMEDISYETISAISEEDARYLLDTTDRLFKPIGLKFYLSFGTLLGAVRDKTLIKGDEDVDVFVEDEELLRKSLPKLSEQGYKVCRIAEGVLYSFRVNESKSYIDIYIRKKLNPSLWSLWCDSLYGKAVPRKLLDPKTSISFLGKEYGITDNPERLLEFWYGEDWRIPVRGHDFIYDVYSHYWWYNIRIEKWDHICWLLRRYFVLYIKRPIKFLIGWNKIKY